jgi:hypothetical protein
MNMGLGTDALDHVSQFERHVSVQWLDSIPA